MSRIKKTILNLSVLFSTVLMANCESFPSTSIRSFQKNLVFNTQNYSYVEGLSDKSNDLFYIECNRILCKVTTETLNDISSDFITKSCEFPDRLGNGSFFHKTFMHPLDHKNVLLTDEYYDVNDNYKFQGFSIFIIRMTDCSVVEMTLPAPITIELFDELATVENEDTFDIFYTVEKKTVNSNIDCQTNICRITYNLDGKLIRGPTKYLQTPNANFKPDEGWLPTRSSDLIASKINYYRKFFPSHGLYRVYSNGTAVELFKSKNIFFHVSYSNSKVGFCVNNFNNSAMCRQYDSKDNDKLLMNFNVSFNSRFHCDLRLYNLKEGGLIMVLVEISRPFRFDEKVENLKIIRVRADGQQSLVMVIPYDKFNVSWPRYTNFLENDQELCFKLRAKRIDRFHYYINYVTYRIECIPKKLFL